MMPASTEDSGSAGMSKQHNNTAEQPMRGSLPTEILTLTETNDGLDDVLQRLSKYDNPSLHVRPDHTLSLENTDIPRPSPTQALVHIRCTGICGSDIHLWHDGRIGPLIVDRPCILGHEAAGEVVAVGSKVTNVKKGDRVAIEPGVPCHNCHVCKAGKYNLCADVEFAGVCPYAGSIRRFMPHESRYCHRIPDDMSFEQGALLEPLSVIMHAIRQCEGSIQLGRPALVCGAGPIGLIAMKCARASGAWPLVITDVDPQRLAFAKEIMPDVQTYLVDLSKKLSPEQCAEEIRALYGCTAPPAESTTTGANGMSSPQHETTHHQTSTPATTISESATDHLAPSTVLECTGIASSIITAAHSIARAGTLMVVGVGASTIDGLPFMHLSLREIKLKFINRYTDTWPSGINAMAGERVLQGMDKLITARFTLEEAKGALEMVGGRRDGGGAGEGSGPVVKVMIKDDVEIEV